MFPGGTALHEDTASKIDLGTRPIVLSPPTKQHDTTSTFPSNTSSKKKKKKKKKRKHQVKHSEPISKKSKPSETKPESTSKKPKPRANLQPKSRP